MAGYISRGKNVHIILSRTHYFYCALAMALHLFLCPSRLAAHEDYHVRNEVVNLKRSLKDAEESRSAIHDCSLSAAKTEQEIAALM